MKRLFVYGIITTIAGLCISDPAIAQGRVNKNALEKSSFYKAPRQIQIIDDRPYVRDFREAPQRPQTIDLPAGPEGYDGGSSGAPGGGLSGGAPSSLPPGGMRMGPDDLGQNYRTPVDPMGALPKSGFGRESNIPARLLGPRSGLQNGQSTNLLGKMLTPQNRSGYGSVASVAGKLMPGVGKGNGAQNIGRAAGPTAAAYNGGYGSSAGSGYGGSTTTAETMVRGSLLRR